MRRSSDNKKYRKKNRRRAESRKAENRKAENRKAESRTAESRRKNKRRRRTKDRKITKMPGTGLLKFNFGVLIFLALAVYLFIIFFSYMSTTHIAGYEVKLGSLALDTTAKAVCVRTEKTYTANSAGYINYYMREGERAAGGELVYAIDESGELSSKINESQSVSSNIKESDLSELKSQIQNYKNTFADSKFNSVYDFAFNIQGTIEQINHANILKMLTGVSGNKVTNSVDLGYSDTSGILCYSTDGLENLKASEVTAAIFEDDNYKKNSLINGDLVSKGDNAFKLITEENWSIVMPWNDSWEDEISDDEYVKVNFLKNDYTIWGKASILTNSDGKYLQLSFTNSMVNFATDRFVNVELITDAKTGFKIPNTSIVQKEFYLIPEEYATKGGDSDADGFLRKSYLENGGESTEFVEAEIYDKMDGQLYIGTEIFNAGDVIVKPDSQDTFTVSTKSSLTGVYNINSGFADFRKINVLYSNKEYSIVESGTMYGLNVYDHIVLNGDGVADKDLMFK